MKIDLRHNFADVQKALSRLPDELRDDAMRIGMNKTIDKGRAEMVRGITSEFNVKASTVRPRLSVKGATKKGGRYFLQAELFVSSGKRSQNLIRFVEGSTTMAEARRRAKAGTLPEVFFKVKKGSAKKFIKGAFIGNNGRTMFVREGDGRLPLKALSVIDTPQMFNTKRINRRVIERMEREAGIEVERAAKVVLARFNAR